MAYRLEQRLAALERERPEHTIIRVVFEDMLDGTVEEADWHVEIEDGVSRVVHDNEPDDQEQS